MQVVPIRFVVDDTRLAKWSDLASPLRHDVTVSNAHLHRSLRLAIRAGATAERIEAVVSALPPTVTATVDFGVGLLTVDWRNGCDQRTWTETANLLLSCDLFARRIRLYCDYAP
jgi:hypothetical protein